MTTHSSFLAWRSPMDRGAWRAAVLISGTTEMDLEDMMPSDISQTKTKAE